MALLSKTGTSPSKIAGVLPLGLIFKKSGEYQLELAHTEDSFPLKIMLLLKGWEMGGKRT